MATPLVNITDGRRVYQCPRKVPRASTFFPSNALVEGSRVGLVPRLKPQSNHSQTAPFSLIIKGNNTTTNELSLLNKRSCLPSQLLHPTSLPLSSGSTTCCLLSYRGERSVDYPAQGNPYDMILCRSKWSPWYFSIAGVPGGLVGVPRAYYDQSRGFKSHRVQTIVTTFFFIKK